MRRTFPFFALVLFACAPPEASDARLASPLDAAFEAAGAEHRVPPELLKALSYTLTRFEMVDGHAEFDGQEETFGVMALRPSMTDDARAHHDPEANIRAAAAWLRARADADGISGAELDDWADVVADYAQLTHPQARAEFFYDVKSLLVTPEVGRVRQAASPDYDLGVWRQSPNFNSRGGRTPLFVIIHTCEGGYSGCWSWQTNPAAEVAAHYTIKEDGSEVSQLVRESDRGWHVGVAYQCSNNQGVRCDLNGVSTNSISVGIEHGGYASQSSFPNGQLEASARLVCSITRRWGIPRDRQHILSHAQLQPHNRTDPGANWPWDTLIARTRDYCNDTCDRTQGGFTFSCDGPQPGETCVSLDEPLDPDTWSDNYLCTERDFGFRWSSEGPLADMDCVNVHEPSEPNAAAWADNYFCAPKQSPWVLSYSSAGPLAGKTCVHLNETADLQNSWHDNYLCFEARTSFTNAGFTFKMDGPVAGQHCVNVDEPADPDTWSDNHFCSEQDLGLRWSALGALPGMACANITESAEAQAAAWADNHLCVPPEARVRFHWSSAGPLTAYPCVRWFDHAETSATWLDNWLCVETLPEPTPDAGQPQPPDAGAPPPDAGPVDPTAHHDAGSAATDAGSGRPPRQVPELKNISAEPVVGGCSAGPGGLLLAAAALYLRRRRRQ